MQALRWSESSFITATDHRPWQYFQPMGDSAPGSGATGQTHILQATVDGDVNAIRELVGGNKDVVQTLDPEQRSLLSVAAAHGHVLAMSFLLKQGIDPLLQDKEGNSCLHAAACADRFDAVSYLCVTLKKKEKLFIELLFLKNKNDATAKDVSHSEQIRELLQTYMDTLGAKSIKANPAPMESNSNISKKSSDPRSSKQKAGRKSKESQLEKPGGTSAPRSKAGRRTAFSNSRKKEQLKQKRMEKRILEDAHSSETSSSHEKSFGRFKRFEVPSVGPQGRQQSAGEFAVSLHEREEEKRERQRKAQQARRDALLPLTRSIENHEPVPVPQAWATSAFDECPIPTRPPWTFEMTKDDLENAEAEAFDRWLSHLYDTYGSAEQLNCFEHNLDFWRQLWRCVEKSDVIVMLADARCPLIHFSPAFYEHVVGYPNYKDFVLCINKVDLISVRQLNAWVQFFLSRYPKLKIAFTISSSWRVSAKTGGGDSDSDTESDVDDGEIYAEGSNDPNENDDNESDVSDASSSGSSASSSNNDDGEDLQSSDGGTMSRLRPETSSIDLLSQLCELEDQKYAKALLLRVADQGGVLWRALDGCVVRLKRSETHLDDSHHSVEVAQMPVAKHLRAARRRKIRKRLAYLDDKRDDCDYGLIDVDSLPLERLNVPRSEVEGDQSCTFHQASDGVPRFVSIGFVGEPNMGKSSLLNHIFGKHLVSTSATPGHTKKFQTHFFSKAVRVLDSPGIVFPRPSVPMTIQVLQGQYPIAQLRDALAVVRFLAENADVDLPTLLGLTGTFWSSLNKFELQVPSNIERHPAVVFRTATKKERSVFLKTGEENDLPDITWSPWLILECIAIQKGFTTRGGRLDVNRAANWTLRQCLRGERIRVSWWPPRSS